MEMEQPKPLSACVTGSFAYTTVKDRLPVILTRVIDYLCREKLGIVDQYGKIATQELKDVIARLSQLKNEMQTNKPLLLFERLEPPPPHDDTDTWNQVLAQYQDTADGKRATWFTAPWLLVECYMYKRIHHTLQNTSSLHSLDPFLQEKMRSLDQSREAVASLEQFTVEALQQDGGVEGALPAALQLSLWGNQSDLSISCGKAVSVSTAALSSVAGGNMLLDDTDRVCRLLRGCRSDDRHVAVVLDNAGYELLTDVCLMLLLLHSGLARSVLLYVKTRPWFVSDTLKEDVTHTLSWLSASGFQQLAGLWQSALSSGQCSLREHPYWTTPEPFPSMHLTCPHLYQDLQQAKLVIFKGDLNYRKLVSDLNWPTDSCFTAALGGLGAGGGAGGRPPPVLAIRTVKGGPVLGVTAGVVDETRLGEHWATSGQCGMIQLSGGDEDHSRCDDVACIF